MEVLFIQLSDMHCGANDDKLNEKIQKIPSALRHLGTVDHVIDIPNKPFQKSRKVI